MATDLERSVVAHAVRSSVNLNEAAERLGASRRTLQNRMREYGMGYGKSGRPREELPKGSLALSGAEKGVFALLTLGLLGSAAWFLWVKRQDDAAQLQNAERERRGLAAILGV